MALSKIQAESMNLADTYAFTGSVSGAGDPADIKLVSSTNITTASVNACDFTSLSTDYNHFILKIGSFVPSGNGGQIIIRLQTTGSSGFASGSNNYDCTRNRVYGGGGSYTSNSGGFTANYGVAGIGQNSEGNGYVESGSHLTAYFYDVHSTTKGKGYTSFFWGGNDSGNTSHMISGVTYVGTGRLSALTGIRVISSNGDIKGRFNLYGVKT